MGAKIGPKKDGATDMTYMPELVVDLESGVVLGAEVLPGVKLTTTGPTGADWFADVFADSAPAAYRSMERPCWQHLRREKFDEIHDVRFYLRGFGYPSH